MVCQSAESAASEAASAAYYTEFDFVKSGYAALPLIYRVILSLIGQFVNVVKFLSLKGHLWHILNHIGIAVIFLGKPPAAYAVVVSVLHCKAFAVCFFVISYLFK